MAKGERIRRARELCGMTQEELGRACETTKQTIFKYESGIVTNIPTDRVERIAEVTGVSPAYIMGWDDQLPDAAQPIDLAHYHKIPILGRIPAGLPLYAEQNIEGYTLTDLNGGAEYFALRVQGDSMNAMGINSGYLIIVRLQDHVENGEVAVVMVGSDDATVKRFHQNGDIVTLVPQSTNPAHTIQTYDTTKTDIKVLGKVVKVEFTL